MNHPLSPSSALLPVVRLVSHLSLLQRLLKVHQDLLLHKSFTAMTVCALAPCFHSVCFSRLFGARKFQSCSRITLVNQTRTDTRKERRKEEGGRRRARWRVTNPNIQNDKWSERFQRRDTSEGSSVTGLFLSDSTLLLHTFPSLEPITDRRWPFFRLIGQNKQGRSASGLSLNRLPVENDFKHYRTVNAWCDQFRSKMSYPAADKCETYSNKKWLMTWEHNYIYSILRWEWNCWIKPLHLNPDCQTEMFLIAYNWQQF